jgi:hypothetical protein
VKQKIQVRAAYARVWLKDEAPTIGQGWRTLGLLHEGRSWLRVEEIATGRTARLGLTAWCDLIRSRPSPLTQTEFCTWKGSASWPGSRLRGSPFA